MRETFLSLTLIDMGRRRFSQHFNDIALESIIKIIKDVIVSTE